MEANPFKTSQYQKNHNNNDKNDKKHETNSSSSSSSWIKLLLVSVIAGTTFTLAIWQTRRYLWKVHLIAEREKTLKNDDLIQELQTVEQEENWLSREYDDDDQQQLLYRKFVLHGRFLNERSVLIGTRQSPVSKRMQLNSRSAGETGYYVVTPFVCEKSGKIIFVNRGWMPKSKTTPEELSKHVFGSDGGGENKDKKEKITVVFREYEKPGYISKDQYRIGESNVFLVMDPSVIADELQMDHLPQYPLFADQMRSGDDDVDRELPMRAIDDDHLMFYVMPHTHIAYMTVWYGLTAWIVGTALYMKYKKRKW